MMSNLLAMLDAAIYSFDRTNNAWQNIDGGLSRVQLLETSEAYIFQSESSSAPGTAAINCNFLPETAYQAQTDTFHCFSLNADLLLGINFPSKDIADQFAMTVNACIQNLAIANAAPPGPPPEENDSPFDDHNDVLNQNAQQAELERQAEMERQQREAEEAKARADAEAAAQAALAAQAAQAEAEARALQERQEAERRAELVAQQRAEAEAAEAARQQQIQQELARQQQEQSRLQQEQQQMRLQQEQLREQQQKLAEQQQAQQQQATSLPPSQPPSQPPSSTARPTPPKAGPPVPKVAPYGGPGNVRPTPNAQPPKMPPPSASGPPSGATPGLKKSFPRPPGAAPGGPPPGHGGPSPGPATTVSPSASQSNLASAGSTKLSRPAPGAASPAPVGGPPSHSPNSTTAPTAAPGRVKLPFGAVDVTGGAGAVKLPLRPSPSGNLRNSQQSSPATAPSHSTHGTGAGQSHAPAASREPESPRQLAPITVPPLTGEITVQRLAEEIRLMKETQLNIQQQVNAMTDMMKSMLRDLAQLK